jgi:hypothetical protein
MGGSHKEKVLQIAALNYLLTLADKYPDSSVRRVELTAKFPPHVGLDDGVVWASKYVPKFQVVSSGVDGSDVCVRYGSVVLTPRVFLPWLRGRLEKRGVVFERVGEVKRLGELKDRGHDVLVNASGLGSMTLEDVKDGKMMMDRTYCTVVRSWFEGAFVRQGDGYYTYIFARGDGTAVVGGVSHPVDEPVKSMEEVHREVSCHGPVLCVCAQANTTRLALPACIRSRAGGLPLVRSGALRDSGGPCRNPALKTSGSCGQERGGRLAEGGSSLRHHGGWLHLQFWPWTGGGQVCGAAASLLTSIVILTRGVPMCIPNGIQCRAI